jgi:protein phosphatase
MTELPEAVVLAGVALEQAQRIELSIGTVVAFTTPGPDRADDANQDALAVIPGNDLVLLAVADGLGGHRGGHEASKLLVHELHEAARDADGEQMRAVILGAFDRVDRTLAAQPGGGASTVVVVEVRRTSVRSYHVGDAGALVVGQRGRVKLRTMDHSPVGYAVAAGLLDEKDALHHDERHVVDNAVGAANMRVEMGSELGLAPRDTLVLGSDGLFDNLHVDEIVDLVRAGPLEECAAALAKACRERMLGRGEGTPSKPDDLSFILFRPRDEARDESPG